MKGIQFVMDETGNRTAVLISLAEWGEIREDIYDVLVSETRRPEATISWDELKAEMDREESLHAGIVPN